MTGVRRAHFSIIAVLGSGPGNARAPRAGIPFRADVSIFARLCIRREQASCLRVALVERTRIGIVTGEFRSRTPSVETQVPFRAGVSIITGIAIGLVQTSRHPVTGIRGAGIPVLTVHSALAQAGSARAGIPLRARIPIIAGEGNSRDTCIPRKGRRCRWCRRCRHHIAPQNHRAPPRKCPPRKYPPRCRDSRPAISIHKWMVAAIVSAGVLCAGIAIIAHPFSHADTLAFLAGILAGAGITIVTGFIGKGVPTHSPPLQVSSAVQEFPSSQGAVRFV